MNSKQKGPGKGPRRINVRLDGPPIPADNDFDEALVAALEKSGTGLQNLLRIRTEHVKVVSQPISPLTERPRTIGEVLRRTFVFEV